MMTDKIPTVEKERDFESINKNKSMGLLSDLKALLKLAVLIANVLPVFTGFWLALYFSNESISTQWPLLLLLLVGSTFVMAGALILNNWYDVDIDSIMDRTKNRPTVTGNIPLRIVLSMGIIFTIIGFIMLLFTTMEAAIYAFIGWFTYVVLYTMWSKRRYAMNTIIGSVSGAVTPLIGWAAVGSTFHIVPIMLAIIIFIWQMPHTFAIAMRKCDEYRAAKVAMLPVVRGFKITKIQMLIYITLLLPLPFFLTSLGTTFIALTSILNVAWLVISMYGFFQKNDDVWARIMFIYSVSYITVVFVSMVVVTLPIFH
nr:heme o synthase [Salipaludibacillus daqingensis]